MRVLGFASSVGGNIAGVKSLLGLSGVNTLFSIVSICWRDRWKFRGDFVEKVKQNIDVLRRNERKLDTEKPEVLPGGFEFRTQCEPMRCRVV